MNIKLLFLLFPIISIAQTPADSVALHLREIPRHHLIVDLGIAQPLGNHTDVARSGLSIGATYDYYFNKNIGLSTSLRHTYNETAFTMQPDGPAPQNESLTQLSVGLVASKTYHRFQLDGYTRIGIALLDVNEDQGFASDNDDRFHFINGDTKNSSAVLDFGLRFNYYFRRSVQVFFSPQIQTTIGNPLVYNTSIESLSSNPIDLQATRREANFTNLLVTVGVKFAIGSEYTSGELRNDLDN